MSNPAPLTDLREDPLFWEQLEEVEYIEYGWRCFRVSIQLPDLRTCEGTVEGATIEGGQLEIPDWSTWEFEEWIELRDWKRELAEEAADRKMDEMRGN